MLAIVLIEIRLGRPQPCQWFRDARENIVIQWAGFGIQPSRTAWYDFVDRIAPLLEQWNAAVLQIALQRGVTQAEHMSLDGTAVAANASRHRLVNEATVEQRFDGIGKRVPSRCGKPAAAQRADVDGEASRDARRATAALSTRPRTLGRIARDQQPASPEKTPKTRENRGQRQRSRGGARPRQIQTSSGRCTMSSLFATWIRNCAWAIKCTPNRPTREHSARCWKRIANGTGVKPQAVLVDAGYVTACNLAICDQAGIALYGPWQENDFSQKKKQQGAKPRPIGKEHFTWVPEQNVYRCPEGHSMPWIGREKRQQSDGQINMVHSYRCSPKHCQACLRQALCCSNPNRGRAIKRSEHEALVEAHRARMATVEAKSLYRLRGQTVELGFADFKQHRAMRQFSGRGRCRAQRQVGLTVLVHNLHVVYCATAPTKNSADAMLTIEKITT